jgi:hypothetical protein
VQGVVLASGGGSTPAILTIPNGAVAFSGGADAAAANTPSGTTFPVTVTATVPLDDGGSGAVPGMTVNFTAQPSGVTVSPAAVITDDGGQATAYAFVPYDTQGVVLVSATGAVLAPVGVTNPPVTLQGDAGTLVGNTPSGSTYPVTVLATARGADGGASAILGFPVSFTAQPASITVSPATVATNDAGTATAYVFVPYDTQGFVLAAGTGAVASTIQVGNGALVLAGDAGAPTDFGPSGGTIPVTVTAETPGSGADGGVAGVSVGFTVQAPAVLASPPMVTTGANGQAMAYVFLPYNSQSIVVAVGGSSLAAAVPVSNPPVALLDAGMPAQSGDITPTGQYWTLSASASVNGSSIPGLSLAFTPLQPGAPATSSFVTGTDGVATATLFAPWGPSELVQIVGGGSTAWATLPAAANPITLSPLCWVDLLATDATPGLYQVTTTATNGNAAVPGVSVTFSVVGVQGSAATPLFQPATAVTNSAGVATSLLALGSADVLFDAGVNGLFQVAVQATAGSSTMVAVIPFGAADGGGCPPP